MDSITQSVKELYESYPYPYSGVKGELLNDLLTLLYCLFNESGIGLKDISKYTFFDAGCGSGQRILGVAKQFPNAKFTGVDLCEHSLNIAKEQAKSQGINNITFRQANLMELNENDRYDVVTSVGVIHHISNPKTALVNIAKLIKDDGILIIHVYHTIGEYERMLKRTIARTLQGDQPLDTGIRIMKEMGYTLPIHQYGLYGYNLNLTEDDVSSKDADVYLHPQVFTYLFEEGIELFQGTSLDWMAVNSINSLKGSYFISTSDPIESYSLNPADCLKTDYLLSLYQRLPMLERLRIIECLTQPTAFSMVAGKKAGLSKIGSRLRNQIVWLNKKG